MFQYHTQIFLHQTDAAGRLFFACQFYLMYEAMEKLAESVGLPIHVLLGQPAMTFPLVHAESDYQAMLVAGDRIIVEAGVEKIGNTSVTIVYRILKADGTLAGTGRTVSVCVDTRTQTKMPVPPEWREKLSRALVAPK
ncbi:MAG: acyl-CoA thioesterase [Candidatus Omnitrophica bacterium]|nr:acyl-CoA thioesterase [Candidatus Omnitrophota bacterium]